MYHKLNLTSYINPQIHVILPFERHGQQAVIWMIIMVGADDLRLAVYLVRPLPAIEHEATVPWGLHDVLEVHLKSENRRK